MSSREESDADRERSVSALISDLRAGKISIKQIHEDDRRACVAHLTAEGLTTVEIGTVLGVTDRTVRRDRAALREDRRLRAAPDLIEQLAGDLWHMTENTIDQIRRAIRERDVPAAVRVAALVRCVELEHELIKRFQAIGYLPTAATHVRADLTHRRAEPMPTEAIRAELERIRAIALDGDTDAETQQKFESFEYAITTICNHVESEQTDDHE